MLLADLYESYNTISDWPALASVVSGVYLKYTDGTGPAQTRADTYASHCQAQNIPYGGYCFAEPGDPLAQADALVREYRRLGGTLAPALDLEADAIPVAARVPFAKAFLQRVHETYPVVVLYSSTSWLATLNPDTWGLPWLRIWAAEYGANTGSRYPVRHYNGSVHLHQYTSAGTVPGAAGHVDLDYADNLTPLLLLPPSTRKPDDEEQSMVPMRLEPSQDPTEVVLIWDGRPAVLNVIAETPGDDVFAGKALCWGPNGGMGGGTPTVTSIATVPAGWRVVANQPAALTIPAGTTRIVYTYSCAGYSQIQVVPT